MLISCGYVFSYCCIFALFSIYYPICLKRINQIKEKELKHTAFLFAVKHKTGKESLLPDAEKDEPTYQ